MQSRRITAGRAWSALRMVLGVALLLLAFAGFWHWAVQRASDPYLRQQLAESRAKLESAQSQLKLSKRQLKALRRELARAQEHGAQETANVAALRKQLSASEGQLANLRRASQQEDAPVSTLRVQSLDLRTADDASWLLRLTLIQTLPNPRAESVGTIMLEARGQDAEGALQVPLDAMAYRLMQVGDYEAAIRLPLGFVPQSLELALTDREGHRLLAQTYRWPQQTPESNTLLDAAITE